MPECSLSRAVDSEERLQDVHIPTLSKKPRTTPLPLRREASVKVSSNICELCRPTTQCRSTNQTMPGGYYNGTPEQAQRFS